MQRLTNRLNAGCRLILQGLSLVLPYLLRLPFYIPFSIQCFFLISQLNLRFHMTLKEKSRGFFGSHTSNMPQQNLQIGPPWQNGVPSFAQQGQVDWVAFGNTIWTLSAAMLQRFAGSGIQPVTYGAGLALASRFRMSKDGRERMDQAMRSLRGIPGLDKILWFGFGHQSFVRIMGDNQLGLNCVALCSCLTEVHSEDVAARVLEELWELNNFPENYEPSHTQFLALVKACSGVVARSGFGRRLDAMTGHGLWLFSRTYSSMLKASNAIEIAKALNALFQITRAEVETITLLGQNECAFVAALADWLFDLAIYIEDDAGEVLFKSFEDLSREGAQVLVIYTEERFPTAIQQSTTYVLPVGTDVISIYNANSESRWIWKVPWNGCLVRTFGSTFQTLSGLSHILGSYLGSAARIYAALATGEPNVAAFSRPHFINFTQLSYGQGFIHSVTSIFEELGCIPGLNDRMEGALDSSLDDACKAVEEAAQTLINMCRCQVCSGILPANPEWEPTLDNKGDCLFGLAVTIRGLIADLACINRDEALLVAVYGLQSHYRDNYALYMSWAEDKTQDRTLVSIAVGLPLVTETNDSPFTHSETLLEEIRDLFDGSCSDRGMDDPEGTTATSSSGICCYRECLKELSSKAAAMRIIHVIPGHIERGAAQYDSVSDSGKPDRDFSIPTSATLTQVERRSPKNEVIHLGKFEVKALATESSTYRKLNIHYKVILPDGFVAQIFPGGLCDHILERTGLIRCYHDRRCKQQLAFPCSTVQSGWAVDKSDQSLHYNAGIALCLWSYQEDIARCVAFNFQSKGHLSSSPTFLRQDECLPCCSESVLRESATIISAIGGDRGIAHVF